jgi:hypothetical protein
MEMIGYCGYNCGVCAARSDDPDLRQKMVDGWRKYFGHEMYTAENVKCGGCRGKGDVADKSCEARPCARERGVDSCADCGEFPCPRVRKLFGSREGMLVHCYPRTAGLTADEYNLCMRQFDSMGRLAERLAARGCLPRVEELEGPDKTP